MRHAARGGDLEAIMEDLFALGQRRLAVMQDEKDPSID